MAAKEAIHVTQEPLDEQREKLYFTQVIMQENKHERYIGACCEWRIFSQATISL